MAKSQSRESEKMLKHFGNRFMLQSESPGLTKALYPPFFEKRHEFHPFEKED